MNYDPFDLHRLELPVWILARGCKAGAFAFSARLVESLDRPQPDVGQLTQAYQYWIAFASVLARRMVDEAHYYQDLDPDMIKLAEECPSFNDQFRDFTHNPTREELISISERWMDLRMLNQKVIEDLLD